MKELCISIDVSKGESHVGSFIDPMTIHRKVFVIKHDLRGFQKIKVLQHEMKEKYEKDVYVVFEATGVYHRGLQNYLEQNNIPYHMISPLLSARFRKQSLRSIKTDKADCTTIAKVYYNCELNDSHRAEDTYYSLQQMSRHYESLLGHLRKCKVSMNEILEIVFPGYDSFFSNLYSDISLAIIKKYPHPEMIENKKAETITAYLKKHTKHRENWIKSKTIAVIDLARNTISGCRVDDVNVLILKSAIEQVEYYENLVKVTLERMIDLAQEMPNYLVLLSIPGIGENLAARILAEIGDIERFRGPKQLIAYTGIEPIIYQSGKNDGYHYRISKRGNKRLRTLLYTAVKCMIRKTTKETSIKKYYHKKTQQENPMNSNAAVIASANKLLRVIYGMCKTGCIYQ
ncbi:MAG: IS110 family transposase [Longicatena sp.]